MLSKSADYYVCALPHKSCDFCAGVVDDLIFEMAKRQDIFMEKNVVHLK